MSQPFIDLQQLNSIRDWLQTGSINLFGRPFVGKDTQGRRLIEMFNGVLLGGGDIMRGSSMPDRIKELMTTGELIPTKDYLEIVLPYLSQSEFSGKPLVLSSVGRWHGEEPGVLEATEAANHPMKAVIFMDLPEVEVWKRFRRAKIEGDRGPRADDTDETLQVRLDEFRNKTLPVIEFYRNKDLLVEIDGSLSPDEVTAQILQGLAKKV